jgi:hypothetical protein
MSALRGRTVSSALHPTPSATEPREEAMAALVALIRPGGVIVTTATTAQ